MTPMPLPVGLPLLQRVGARFTLHRRPSEIPHELAEWVGWPENTRRTLCIDMYTYVADLVYKNTWRTVCMYVCIDTGTHLWLTWPMVQ